MNAVGHVMILASAGSGKTYALTNRFVRLLAMGAPPERIMALTFTRKAAGEFFDEILNKLARAATDAPYAAQLGRETGHPALAPADFRTMLRTVAEAMHRLRLGTFDGFFARVARNFPLELGLTGEFEILQEHAAQMERARVLRRLFARTGDLADAQREFIEAFKRATFGTEEKRLGTQLDRFIDAHQEAFLAAPDGRLWGNPAAIWPDGCAWLEAAAHRDDAATGLQAALATLELSEAQRSRVRIFLAELAVWRPGAPMGRGLLYLFGNALAAWPDLGEIVIERRKVELPPPARTALRRLLAGVIGAELARRLEVTRGIHAVLGGYEAAYHDAVRRAGKLTFGDVERLLAPQADGTRTLTRAGAGEGRLYVDYRLDAEIDHWLLDEFQDTSFGQWSVLKNLIDEVVQDPTQARSFFYVGDVKQAIFAWREGDPRLFREIYDHYNAAQPGTIREEHLVRSWRSGPPVIAMVNRVFGASTVMAELFPPAAAALWNREWRDHESARPQLGGHAALLHAEDEAARFAAARGLIEEIKPLDRGLTCALLVQKNDTAARLADYLRREGGLPAVAESDLHVCTDNPVGTALLALFQSAAHPGDTLARGHLLMTPLGDVLAGAGCATPEDLTLRLLAQVHTAGFERAAETWIGLLLPRLAADDDFSRRRAWQFAVAAAQFDATGSRDVAEFIAFMGRYTVRESDSAAVIRVMTVHKAKGLGFDLVILPDLEGTKLAARRDGLAVQRAADRSVEWVLDLPVRQLCEPDPVLLAHVQAAEADACYEQLSLLYVAMTRAKRGMYLITEPGVKRSSSRNFSKLLDATLGEGGHEGDARWYEAIAPVAPSTQPAGPPTVGVNPSVGQKSHRLPARRPSAEGKRVIAAAPLFSAAAGHAAEFGAAVHAWLAQVEWLDGADSAGWSGAAGREARDCLMAPALAEVWTRPFGPGSAEIWRERPFEVVLDGTWVTGVFDRVVVQREPGGAVRRAAIYDFKTDADSDAAAIRHAAQMNLYREAGALLTGLDASAVTCKLVLTRPRRLVTVPPAG